MHDKVPFKIREDNCAYIFHEESISERIIAFSYEKDKWLVKISTTYQETKTTKMEMEIKCDIPEKFLAKVLKINTSIFETHIMGCDGSFTELEIGDYSGFTKIRWWASGPEKWREIVKMTNALIKRISTLAKNYEQELG